jgi:hypothetical protein
MIYVYKACPTKNLFYSNLVFKISHLFQHRMLKILVPIPHNRWGIMGGRDKNL